MDQYVSDANIARSAAKADAASPQSHAFSSDTVGELFLRSALRHAARPALWVDGNTISYGELLDLAGRIAHALIGAGFGRGTARCAVLGNRGLTDFAGILGASLARCTYVPLNARHPPQRLAQVMRDAEAQALIVDHQHLDHARAILRGRAASRSGAAARFARRTRLGHHHPASIASLRVVTFPRRASTKCRAAPPRTARYLLFTSGSTGAPKGVLVRNRNAMPYLRSVAARYAPSPDDRCTQLFDLTFDLSVHDMFLCWGAGATLYRVPDNARFAPRDFVRRHGLTMWFSVPSTAAMMLGLRALRPGDFPSLRLGLFCGEALPKRLALAWAAAAPNAVIENLYGPTEATIALTAFRLPRDPRALEALPEVMPIGARLPNQDALPVDGLRRPRAGRRGRRTVPRRQPGHRRLLAPSTT